MLSLLGKNSIYIYFFFIRHYTYTRGVTLAQLVKASVGSDFQKFEPHLGHNSCKVQAFWALLGKNYNAN